MPVRQLHFNAFIWPNGYHESAWRVVDDDVRGVLGLPYYAELVFSGPPSLAAAVGFRAELHRQAAAAGRNPDQVLVLPALMITLGGTEAEAAGPGPACWRNSPAPSSAGRTRST